MASVTPLPTPPAISRRDYFAGLAMQALLRNRNAAATTGSVLDKDTELLANAAWNMADVMLRQDERRKIEEQQEEDQILQDTSAL